MINRDSWFGWFMFTVSVIFISCMVFFVVPESLKRTQECQQQGGIMVKSPSGWVCIDAQRMK